MGHKKVKKPTGISKIVWDDVNRSTSALILETVKQFCSSEDCSTLTEEEMYKILNLAENPFVKLIFASAEDAGYNSF